jgi:predicted transcriptional regulator
MMEYEKTQSATPVSTLQVLDVLSDRMSLHIINVIAEKFTSTHNIRELLGLTSKEYYMRHSRLLKTGIIKRNDAKLTLTSFGQLIYRALLKIATAFRHYHELIIIDAIKSSAEMPHNELKDLIDKVIHDAEIKNLFS